MRISIALLDKDKEYTKRLVKGLQLNYEKELSLRVFSEPELFLNEIVTQHFDVTIMDYEFIHLKDKLPNSTVIATFVQDNSIDEIEKIPAVGRYQKIENIYKRIISIYADNAADIKVKTNNRKSNTVLFTSAQGGCGTSTVAAAYAISLARRGKKVLYLNLENFGSSSLFFHGEGQGSFSDVIYAIKSTNVNFLMKLSTVIKKDLSGVEYIEDCKNAFDMLEIKDSEIEGLMNGIYQSKGYDVVVVDYSAALSDRQLLLMKEMADSIIYVNDGSDIGNQKFQKFSEVIRVIEKKENCSILSKISLIYNRYSSQTSRQLDKLPVALLGGISRIEGISGRELINRISENTMIANIK